MRTQLKLRRVAMHMTQEEAADAIGCSRETYHKVENGTHHGSIPFWSGVQKAFHISGEQMWEVMQNDGEE